MEFQLPLKDVKPEWKVHSSKDEYNKNKKGVEIYKMRLGKYKNNR